MSHLQGPEGENIDKNHMQDNVRTDVKMDDPWDIYFVERKGSIFMPYGGIFYMKLHEKY